jgi:hypothetical protein
MKGHPKGALFGGRVLRGRGPSCVSWCLNTVRSPQPNQPPPTESTPLCSYINNPKANAENFTAEGWFRTGDQGRLDEAGYLFLTGGFFLNDMLMVWYHDM